MKKVLAGLLTVLFAFGMAGMASASTYNTSVEIDLVNGFDTLVSGSSTYFRANQGFVLDSQFTAGQGDKVIVDVTFADNKALKVFGSTGDEYFYGSISAGVSNSYQTISSGYLDFTGVGGILLTNHVYSQQHSGFGNSVHSPSVSGTTNLTDTWFSFSGMRLEIDIDSMLNSPSPFYETTGNFTSSWFQFGGDDFEVVSAAPVPEPATWLLLSSGLAGLAFYNRKHKKA